MDILQLKYFISVAETGHLTKAAKSLFIAQPALSRSIARLEAEIGVPLFERKGRGIQLSEYGKLFLVHARRVVSEINQAETEKNDLLGTASTRIRLGSNISGIAMPVMQSFCEANPKTQFHYEAVYENSELLEKISEEKLDIGFCDALIFPSDIEHTPIWNDTLYALVRKGEPLSEQRDMTLGVLQTQPLVISITEASLLEQITLFFGSMLPENYSRTSNMQDAVRICMLGQGIAITSGFFLEMQILDSVHGDMSLLDIITPVPIRDCNWSISLVWKRTQSRSRLLRAFHEHIIQHYQAMSKQSIMSSIVNKENR